jgi:hypothetical protein
MTTDAEYHGLEVLHPMWALTAVHVAKRGRAFGAPKPVGHKGGLGVNYFPLADGRIRWRLVYAEPETGKQTQVAKWTTDWLPDDRITKQRKPVNTEGRIVTINAGVAGGIARQVRVVIDALGLPVPVPLEYRP